MPQYLSPGVFVEEVPSAIKPIAGVSTSTAGFIGVAPDTLEQPLSGLSNASIGTGDGTVTAFALPGYYSPATAYGLHVRVTPAGGTPAAAAGVTLTNDDTKKTSSVTFATAPAKDATVTADVFPIFKLAPAGEPKLCTNFGEYKKFFGDFSSDKLHSHLTQAVYGFFNNGGGRCYVMRI